MVWTEKDLFRDCAIKHSDIAPNQALGEHTYAAVWSALRSWLLTLFNRCRGGVFPNFARITWRRVGDQLEDGVPMLRPIFVTSDAYLRLHLLHTGSGVAHASGIEAAELEPCEEYSAMKIAIKYSCALNKDVVFCCTRHLLQHLGEALRSGRPLELDLGVGVLTGRDRCLAFRFHSQYLAHWPAMAAARLAPKAPAAAPASRDRRVQQQGQQMQRGNVLRVEFEPGGRRGTTLWCGDGSGNSVGGSSTHTEEDADDSRSPGGAAEVRQALEGNTAAAARDAGSLRRGCQGLPDFPHPGSGTLQKQLQQQQETHGSEQPEQSQPQGQQQELQCNSPGPCDKTGRQPGRSSGPPPSPRSRPAWGVRVPPPPPSPGRRGGPAGAATTAAPASPRPPTSSAATAVRHGSRPASASPGAELRAAHGQNEHLAEDAMYDLPYSPGRSAAVDAALPVGRAVHLAARTPRQRPISPGPGPGPHSSGAHINYNSHDRHVRTAHALQYSPNGAAVGISAAAAGAAGARQRPLSAPRCRPAGCQPDVAANASADAAMNRQGRPVSPGPQGAASAVVRPPWGSGLGARSRSASAGGAPGAVRPSSTPRLRGRAVAAPAEAHAATVSEQERLNHWKRVAWAADGGAGGSGGEGGSGGGVDVQQLWSPDSNLKAATGRTSSGGGSRGPRAGSVRALFGGGAAARHGAPGQMVNGGGAGSDSQAQQAPRQVREEDPPQCHVNQQPWTVRLHAAGGANAIGPDSDDQIRSDQQHKPQQQVRPHGDCKSLAFLTTQKELARPVPASPAQRPVGAPHSPSRALGQRGSRVSKPQPESRAAAASPSQAADGQHVMGLRGDEPDHSPQLRRDQFRKQLPAQRASPELPKRPMPAARPADGPGTSPPRRTIVRTFSPGADTQHCNLRYGMPAGRDLPYCGSEAMADDSKPAARRAAGSSSGSLEVQEPVQIIKVAAAASAGGRGPHVDCSLALCAAATSATAVASPAAAVGNTWDRNVAARAAAGPQGLAQTPLYRGGVSPLPPAGPRVELAAVSSSAAPQKGNGSVHEDASTWLSCSFGSSVDNSIVLTRRSLHKGRRSRATDGASDGGASMVGVGSRAVDAPSAAAASGGGGSRALSSDGGGIHMGDLSSSCCGVPTSGSLDVGYALPLYESSIDGGLRDGSCGSIGGLRSNRSSRSSSVAVANALALTADPAVYATDHAAEGAKPSAGAITATVRAALGRQRRSVSSNGGRITDQLRATPDGGGGGTRSRRSSASLTLQGLCPHPESHFDTAKVSQRTCGDCQYADAFPVPMIVTEQDLPEQDLPEPAWGSALQGKGPAASRALPPPTEGSGTEPKGTQPAAFRRAKAGQAACGAASSGEQCWSARLGRQDQDQAFMGSTTGDSAGGIGSGGESAGEAETEDKWEQEGEESATKFDSSIWDAQACPQRRRTTAGGCLADSGGSSYSFGSGGALYESEDDDACLYETGGGRSRRHAGEQLKGDFRRRRSSGNSGGDMYG